MSSIGSHVKRPAAFVTALAVSWLGLASGNAFAEESTPPPAASSTPSATPTPAATAQSTAAPSGEPTTTPTVAPSSQPTVAPSAEPTTPPASSVAAPGDTKTIAQIQGEGAASPELGNQVTTSGIVTAVYKTGNFNGYYLQTPGTGGDTDLSVRKASDALFVYSSATVGSVAIGDFVQVSGKVAEYKTNAQTLTQLTVAAGGATKLSDARPAVVPIDNFVLPSSDDRREVFEGMLVQPGDKYFVSDTYQLGGYGTTAFGSIGLGLGGPLKQETDVAVPGSAEYAAAVADNAARAVTLDDGQSARTAVSSDVPYLTGNPDIRTGVQLSFTKPVVFEWRFQWNFQPTTPVTGASDLVSVVGGNIRAANASPQAVGGDIKLASFNVLNYFTTFGKDVAGCTSYVDRNGVPLTVKDGCDARGAWDETNLKRQEGKLVAAINGLGADVVGLEEIENSAKFGKDRDNALKDLVNALNAAAGAGTWAYAPSPATLPTLEEQDAIRTAFIYKPATVKLVGDSVVLVGDAAFSNAREPLAQAFAPVSNPRYSFVAVTNHFKSKGGSCGTPAPAEGCFNADRVAQASSLVTFANATAAAAGAEDVFLLGDFNAYSKEGPVTTIEAAGFKHLNPAEASYVFNGRSGSIDHLFANASAAAKVTGADVWRINADESVLAEYSRYNYFASSHFEAGSAYRASDHNPIIVGIAVPKTSVTIDVAGINDFHGRIQTSGQSAGAPVLACALKAVRAQNPNTMFVSAGDLIGASTFESSVAKDQPTIDLLNKLGLQTSALGNHEFDKGQDDLNNRVIPASSWTYLSANLYRGDKPAYPEYKILEADGVRVAFIGATTEELPTLVAPSGMTGLTVRDMLTEVNRVVANLASAKAADVFVVLVHDGAATSDLTSASGTKYGALVNGVDSRVSAIMSGHTHQLYAQQVKGVWVTQSAQYGEQLGRLTITFDKLTGKAQVVKAWNEDLVSDKGAPLCAPDPEIKALVDAAVKQADVLGAVPIGAISADFKRAVQPDGKENRGGESTIGNYIADVQLWAAASAGAEIAVINPGGIRTDLTYKAAGAEGDGVVTFKEAAMVQPFANTIMVTSLTGAQLKNLLEQQWQPDGAARPFLKLGVSKSLWYSFDPTRPKGDRITQIKVNGVVVSPTSTYKVAANSFLMSGGDAFAEFTKGSKPVDTGWVDLDAMVAYFKAKHPAAGSTPAAPDYAQRAVGVTYVTDPAKPLSLTGSMTIDLSSLSFTGAEPKPTIVSAYIGRIKVGTFTVDNTVTSANDLTGVTQVRIPTWLVIAAQYATFRPWNASLVLKDDVNGTVLETQLRFPVLWSFR